MEPKLPPLGAAEIVVAAAVVTPAGGETLAAGMPLNVQFMGTDNDALSSFAIAYSTDGGSTFPNEIGRTNAMASSIIWNIPDTLVTNQGRIQVMATDVSGNRATAVSGMFTVQRPQTMATMLQVMVSFTPPPQGQVLPPQNVMVNAVEVSMPTVPIITNANARQLSSQEGKNQNNQSSGMDSNGFNIYRVMQPEEGQPTPTPEQIVGDPRNLVGSLPSGKTTFMDLISTVRGSNFIYSVTTVTGGQQSMGSQPVGTNLPVVKNPIFEKGSLSVEQPGSFIKDGASLIVNQNENYTLLRDSNSMRFVVLKKTPSMPTGLKIKKIVKVGSIVKLKIMNPDGKASVTFIYTRPK